MNDSYDNLMNPSKDIKYLLDVVSEINGEIYDTASEPDVSSLADTQNVEPMNGDFGLTVVVHSSDEVVINYMGMCVWNSEDDPRYSERYEYLDDGKCITIMPLRNFLVTRMKEIADFNVALLKQMYKDSELVPQRELPLEED
jgi:hypothetical protein